MIQPWPGPSQWRRLTETFIARFFDNEITSGTNDLKFSFFWLVAFLAPIGFLMPWFRIVTYQTVFVQGGPELLQRFSMADKALYLGFSMVAAGAIGVISWNALSLDRRDALVLGALPLPARTVVAGKLAALLGYVALVTAGMHLASALSFSVVLGMGRPLSFVLAGVWAHLLASVSAGAAVLFAMAALQGLVLATLGARRFWTLSRGLQLTATGIVVFGLLSLPDLSRAAVSAIDPRTLDRSWALATPPVWFLGLYEWALGSRDPFLWQLAWRAIAATGFAMTLCAVTLPLTYHRLLKSVLENGHGPAAGRARPTGWIERRVRRPELRGALQFMRITMRRSDRQRGILVICGGTVAALTLLASVTPREVADGPSIAILALPLLSMAIVLVGLRIAVSVPADLRASWIFDLSNAPPRSGPSTLRVVCYAWVVAPITIGVSLVNGSFWGIGPGVAHAALCASTGAIIVEGLLLNLQGMPFSRPWRGERANLRLWWPAYVALFLLLSRGLPQLSLGWSERPLRLYTVVALFIAAAVVLLRMGRGRQSQDTLEDTPETQQTIGLS